MKLLRERKLNLVIIELFDSDVRNPLAKGSP